MTQNPSQYRGAKVVYKRVDDMLFHGQHDAFDDLDLDLGRPAQVFCRQVAQPSPYTILQRANRRQRLKAY